MIPEKEPDVEWVGRLANAPVPEAERMVTEAQNDRALFRHLAAEHRTEGRSFYVEIEAPLELYALTRLLRPRHVVEVGVSSGVSSAYFLAALDRNGRGTLHSVDLPRPDRRPRRDGTPRASWTIPVGRASGWAVPFRLRRRWDLRLGDKADVLPLLADELDAIDVFLYDVPHSDPGAGVEFRAVGQRFHEGTVALVDHGGTQEICPSLRRWARARRSTPTLRAGLGLAAFRCASAAG